MKFLDKASSAILHDLVEIVLLTLSLVNLDRPIPALLPVFFAAQGLVKLHIDVPEVTLLVADYETGRLLDILEEVHLIQ